MVRKHGNVTESIFSGGEVVVPLAEVQFLERRKNLQLPEGQQLGFAVVLSGSTWNTEVDDYNNAVVLFGDEAKLFVRAWTDYRHELERDTLALMPGEGEKDHVGVYSHNMLYCMECGQLWKKGDKEEHEPECLFFVA